MREDFGLKTVREQSIMDKVSEKKTMSKHMQGNFKFHVQVDRYKGIL